MSRQDRVEKVEAILGSSVLPTPQVKAYAVEIVGYFEEEVDKLEDAVKESPPYESEGVYAQALRKAWER